MGTAKRMRAHEALVLGVRGPMKILAARIKRQLLLDTGKWGHCAIYENELQRIWPLNEEHRKAKIEQFAKEYGFCLSFYKPGVCAIFEKERPGRAEKAQDPAKVDPVHYKVILNDQRVRVLDVHHKPGEKSPMHSHPYHVVYSFTDSRVKFTSSDGKTEIRTVKAGQAKWHDAETHAVENVGKTEEHALDIELEVGRTESRLT